MDMSVLQSSPIVVRCAQWPLRTLVPHLRWWKTPLLWTQHCLSILRDIKKLTRQGPEQPLLTDPALSSRVELEDHQRSLPASTFL